MSIQKYATTKLPSDDQIVNTEMKFNNYLIFTKSYNHLVENKNLYTSYPKEHFDLFKYSPTFAFFMGIFRNLDLFTGVLIWNLLNASVFAFSLIKINLNRYNNLIVLPLLLITSVTSLQNTQSNLLVLGCIILSFHYLRNQKILLAALLFNVSIFIKIFGILLAGVFLFFKRKGKMILYTVLSTLFLSLLPAILVGYKSLFKQYDNWLILLKSDEQNSYGDSVQGLINRIFGASFDDIIIVPISLLILLLPLIRFRLHVNDIFRNKYLAFLLIYMVIFNHKAESATFVIAITGVSIWYINSVKNTGNKLLLVLVFLFTVIPMTDLIPGTVNTNFFLAYKIKVIPCLIVWIKIFRELMTNRKAGPHNEPAFP